MPKLCLGMSWKRSKSRSTYLTLLQIWSQIEWEKKRKKKRLTLKESEFLKKNIQKRTQLDFPPKFEVPKRLPLTQGKDEPHIFAVQRTGEICYNEQ